MKAIKSLIYEVVKEQQPIKAKNKLSGEQWFKQKLGVKVVQRGLKHTCSNGKTYPAVRFDNNRLGVYVRGGNILKYAF